MAALGVQDDDVPGTKVEAVVALGRIARGRAEVAEIPGGAVGQVLVVADRRMDQLLELTPRLVEDGRVLLRGVALVLVVAERDDGRRLEREDLRGGRRLVAVGGRALVGGRATGDVAGGCDDWIIRRHAAGGRGHSRRDARPRDRARTRDYGQSEG